MNNESWRFKNGFDLIVADEIQRIKNAKAAASKNMKDLGKRAHYRWGLSATPVENALDDLVSIFEFLKPGLLRRDRTICPQQDKITLLTTSHSRHCQKFQRAPV